MSGRMAWAAGVSVPGLGPGPSGGLGAVHPHLCGSERRLGSRAAAFALHSSRDGKQQRGGREGWTTS